MLSIVPYQITCKISVSNKISSLGNNICKNKGNKKQRSKLRANNLILIITVHGEETFVESNQTDAAVWTKIKS